MDTVFLRLNVPGVYLKLMAWTRRFFNPAFNGAPAFNRGNTVHVLYEHLFENLTIALVSEQHNYFTRVGFSLQLLLSHFGMISGSLASPVLLLQRQ